MPGEEHYQFSKDTWVSQIEEDKVAGRIQDAGGERNGIKAGACCWGVEGEGGRLTNQTMVGLSSHHLFKEQMVTKDTPLRFENRAEGS